MNGISEVDSRAIERANSYRQMMVQWSWKDFSIILDTIRKDALESGINAAEMSDVQVQRGIVKCIDQIRGELGYILGSVETK